MADSKIQNKTALNGCSQNCQKQNSTNIYLRGQGSFVSYYYEQVIKREEDKPLEKYDICDVVPVENTYLRQWRRLNSEFRLPLHPSYSHGSKLLGIIATVWHPDYGQLRS